MLQIMMILDRLADKLKSEEGAGMAEYALLLVLVGIACIVIFGNLVTAIGNAVTQVSSAITAAN